MSAPNITPPSLHEIAAMPYSQTLKAIREHYDPAWGKNTDDGEPIKAWRVQFNWEVRGRFDEIIEADSEEDALALAKECVGDDIWSDDVETDCEKITPAKVAEA